MWAGGAWLEPSWERVEAGDHVELSATVSPGAYGWLEHGPYYAYLQGGVYGRVTTSANGGAATDVPLGQLQIEETGTNLTVSIAFNLAHDVPPGEYWIMVCNDPCTTGLGDLIGGVIYVGMDPSIPVNAADPPPAAAATGIAATSQSPAQRTLSLRLGLAPSPNRPTQLSPLWIGISAALGGAVLLAALVSRQRG